MSLTSTEEGAKKRPKKKLLENPMLASMVVPLAIVLVGALIIWGITSMLSTDRGYRDLVQELNSKTFGNRWVAAYELSKVLASKRIPKEEMPWVIDNLSDVYKNTPDERTRNFIVLALGSLKDPQVVPFLFKALKAEDSKVRFNAVVAIGNMPQDVTASWVDLMELLKNESDPGIQQAAIYALAHHQVKGANLLINGFLESSDASVRYAAATALINYKDEKAIPVLKEILFKEVPEKVTAGFDAQQVNNLKLNVLNAVMKNKWALMKEPIDALANSAKSQVIEVKAKEVLNILKF